MPNSSQTKPKVVTKGQLSGNDMCANDPSQVQIGSVPVGKGNHLGWNKLQVQRRRLVKKGDDWTLRFVFPTLSIVNPNALDYLE
jgi:hypothetical protein